MKQERNVIVLSIVFVFIVFFLIPYMIFGYEENETELSNTSITSEELSEVSDAEKNLTEETATEISSKVPSESFAEVEESEKEEEETSLIREPLGVEESEIKESEEEESVPEESTIVEWTGEVLNDTNGTVEGPSGKETYYNLDMTQIVDRMHRLGYDYEYYIREDGVKMLGPYVMCAANLDLRPRGTLVETSLGLAIVCDTGGFAKRNPTQIDIAVDW